MALVVPGQAKNSDFDDNQPGLVNEVLASLFGAESWLVNRASFPLGVSLVATYRPPRQNATSQILSDPHKVDLYARALKTFYPSLVSHSPFQA